MHLNHIALYFLPPFSLGMITLVQETSFCVFFLNVPPNLTTYFMIPRFVLSTLLLILALMRTLKESFAMYKGTKQWQPNQYIRLLVKDGIIYFFTYVNRFFQSICPSHLLRHLPLRVVLRLPAYNNGLNDFPLNQESTLQYHRNNPKRNRVYKLQPIDELPGLLCLFSFCHDHATVHHQRAGVV